MDQHNHKRILIIGGGISGIATMRSLISHGFEPTLIEKNSQWGSMGTGIYIPGNGLDALDRLGLGDKARQLGAVINHRHILSGDGKLLMRLDLQSVWHKTDPCLGILRRDLHEILVEGLDQANIHLGTTVKNFHQKGDAVEVNFSNDTRAEYDLIIAADGLNSATRQQVLGSVKKRQVSSLTCRFVAERPPQFSKSDWTLYVGEGSQFLSVPVNDKDAYFYVGRQDRKNEPLTEQNFLSVFKNFPEPVASVINSVKNDQLYWSPLEELASLNSMGDRRIVIIGDAAHAMPPFMAQGASLGLEDALVLGNWLSQSENWADAAGEFTRLRKSRISWTLQRNQRREKLTTLPYWLAKLGMRLVGKKSWREDYAPLAKPADGLGNEQQSPVVKRE